MNCFRCGVEIHTPYSVSIDGKASCSAFCFVGQSKPADAPAIVVEIPKPAIPAVAPPKPAPKPPVKAPEPKVVKPKAVEAPKKKGKK